MSFDTSSKFPLDADVCVSEKPTFNERGKNDSFYMTIAIQEAKKSSAEGGIPIGAILVKDGIIIGRGHNRRIQSGNPLIHAEIDCLSDAFRQGGYHDIEGSILYTTHMPCYLCSGAIIQYGISRVVSGECTSFPHAQEFLERMAIPVENLQNEECIHMLQEFAAAHKELWKSTSRENSFNSTKKELRERNQVSWHSIRKDVDSLVRNLHKELGWFNDEDLRNTPTRVTGLYKEFYERNTERIKVTKFDSPIRQINTLISLKNIHTISLCEHHILPCENVMTIGYLPDRKSKVCGLSKLARIAVKLSSKPTMQEYLSQEIADFVLRKTHACFAVCVIQGRHDCCRLRGANQPATTYSTHAISVDTRKIKRGKAEQMAQEFISHLELAELES